MHCARRPVIYSVDAVIIQTLLKSRRIFSKIMQQASQFGFSTEVQRRGKFAGEGGNARQMFPERLPATLVQQLFPVRGFGRMRVKLHVFFPDRLCDRFPVSPPALDRKPICVELK